MIFDFHTHVYPADTAGFWKKPSSTQQLIAAMDAAGVGRAAVIAIAPHIANEVVVGAVREFPDRLVPIGSVDPLSPGAMKALDDAVTRLGVRAIKIHPRLQHFGIEQLSALVPIAERCAELRVPLMICSFQGGPDMYRTRTLELCGQLAAASASTTIVMAHAGGHQPMETLLLMKAHPNLWVDISFTPLYFRGSSVVQDLEYLVLKADRRRVLFGSDFPEVSITDSVAFAVGMLDRLHFGSADIDAVLAANGAGLLMPA